MEEIVVYTSITTSAGSSSEVFAGVFRTKEDAIKDAIAGYQNEEYTLFEYENGDVDIEFTRFDIHIRKVVL